MSKQATTKPLITPGYGALKRIISQLNAMIFGRKYWDYVSDGSPTLLITRSSKRLFCARGERYTKTGLHRGGITKSFDVLAAIGRIFFCPTLNGQTIWTIICERPKECEDTRMFVRRAYRFVWQEIPWRQCQNTANVLGALQSRPYSARVAHAPLRLWLDSRPRAIAIIYLTSPTWRVFEWLRV